MTLSRSRPLNRVRGGLGAAAALAAALLIPSSPGLAQSTPEAPGSSVEEGTLQVSGQAHVQVPADRTRISFGVETESSSAEEATRENAAKMDAVVRALRASGMEGLELETFGYSLTPQYRRPRPQESGMREISGYRVTNQIHASFPGTEGAGTVLDVAIDSGANRVVNLSFEATETRSARLRALEMAVEAAMEEARTIAGAMGLRLGPALEIRGGASTEGPRPVGMAFRSEAAPAAPPTPIEAGGQTVSANVSITYRVLEGGR